MQCIKSVSPCFNGDFKEKRFRKNMFQRHTIVTKAMPENFNLFCSSSLYLNNKNRFYDMIAI